MVDSNGTPFFVQGDACWSICVQLTRVQIDTYLNDRKAKGFNALLWNLIESVNSSQSPKYRNREGNDPFLTMTNFAQPNDAYWGLIDYIFAQTRSRGMVNLVEPAYLGFYNEVWGGAVDSASDASLVAYGHFLATRYGNGYGNVIWVMGGDREPADPGKQWKIIEGIRSITPDAVVTGHGLRGVQGNGAFATWGALPGFNLSNIYTESIEYTLAAAEYSRSPVLPFINIEGFYDGEGASPADCRRQAYASILSGACGHVFGNNPVWGFGEPLYCGGGGPANALSTSLNTTATRQMPHVLQLFMTFEWHRLRPSTGTALVTSALGSGSGRICPALADNGSFALVWKPVSGAMTVNFAALTPSSVRARWYDPTNGSYASVPGSPFPNTGAHSISTPGNNSAGASDWLLLLDSA